MENNQKSRRVKKFQKRHDMEHFFSLSRLSGIETALHFPSGQKLK